MTEDELKKRLSEKFTRHVRRCDEFLAVIPAEDRKGKSAWRVTYDFTDGIKISGMVILQMEPEDGIFSIRVQEETPSLEGVKRKSAPKLATGSVPVSIAAKVYGKDVCWVRAGLICEWLPIGNATRNGKLVTTIEKIDSKYGRINYYISPRLLYEQTGYVWIFQHQGSYEKN